MAPPRKVEIRLRGDEPARWEYDRILRLTGEVAVAWAGIESHLVAVLRGLVDCSHSAAEVIYYSPSSFSGRLAIIQNLVSHEMPACDEKRSLLKILERLSRLSKARNVFVHSTLSFVSAGGKVHLSRRVMHPSKQSIESEYRATANDIQQHLDSLAPFYQFLHFMLIGDCAETVRYWLSAALKTASANSSFR